MGAENNSTSVTLRVDLDSYQEAKRQGFVKVKRVNSDYTGSE